MYSCIFKSTVPMLVTTVLLKKYTRFGWILQSINVSFLAFRFSSVISSPPPRLHYSISYRLFSRISFTCLNPGLVNQLLADDRDTNKQNLGIERYAVIPLSNNVGIVGWVPNCDTLYQLIKEFREKVILIKLLTHQLQLNNFKNVNTNFQAQLNPTQTHLACDLEKETTTVVYSM